MLLLLRSPAVNLPKGCVLLIAEISGRPIQSISLKRTTVMQTAAASVCGSATPARRVPVEDFGVEGDITKMT